MDKATENVKPPDSRGDLYWLRGQDLLLLFARENVWTIFALAQSFGRYAFGYADLRCATVQPLKTRQVKAPFLNALVQTPAVKGRKKTRHTTSLYIGCGGRI
ncbi:MAG TPA: hypothetical protein DIC18_04375 [Clostridiales bacterium]|nr:hypothetical protein [Clostridiales bacterium]